MIALRRKCKRVPSFAPAYFVSLSAIMPPPLLSNPTGYAGLWRLPASGKQINNFAYGSYGEMKKLP